jgi:hypothetical protein
LSHNCNNKPVEKKETGASIVNMKLENFSQNLNQNGVKQMKITYAIATLLVTTLASFVQATPNTNELTGDLAAVYLNQPFAVQAGTPIMVGCSLARPAVLKGEVDVAVNLNATAFNAFGTNVFTGLEIAGGNEAAPTSDNHWIIEFTSGAYTGLIKQVVSFSGSTVNVAGPLPVIDKGTRFVLRKDHTLGSLFGDADLAKVVTKSGLTSGRTAGSSDVVSVLNSAGQWAKYFFKEGTGWRLTTDPTSLTTRQHVRVSLGTGVLLSPVLSKTIGLSGEYRGTRSRVTLVNAASIVANPYPVSTPLGQTDLASTLTKGNGPSTSDEIRVLQSSKFVNYFARSGTNVTSPGLVEYGGFKPSLDSRTTNNVDSSITIPAGGAVLVKRAGNAHDLTFRPQYLAQ